MRVNIYAEEMTNRIQIISKEIDGQKFTGLRIYLYLPVTTNLRIGGDGIPHLTADSGEERGPFIHRQPETPWLEGDDDSSAITFWGKRDLREVLQTALDALTKHYDGK